MQDKMKLFLLKLYSRIIRYLLPRHFSFGRSCFVLGRPSYRVCRGSQIRIGDHVTLISNPRFNPLVEYPVAFRTLTSSAVIDLAPHVGISGCRLVCCNRISIGEYTIIGPGTLIYDSEGHSYSAETGWQGRSARSGRPITIGKKCFIGARCIILSGVSIGDNCVIAAGTVVTRDIPSGHKASGNPAAIVPLPKLLGGPGRQIKTH